MQKVSQKIIDNILHYVIVGLLSFIAYFVVDTRDFVKYRQPQRDLLQDIKIQRADSIAKQVRIETSEKNRATQKRLDKIQDKFSHIDDKLNKIIETQKQILYKQKFIFLQVKELQPYQNMITEKSKLQ